MRQDGETERDERSYYELVVGFQSKLYAFISALMAGDENASDVLQETNVVLWEKASSYERGTAFSSWTYRIAHFQALAHGERQGRDRRLLFSETLVSMLANDYKSQTDDLDEQLAAPRKCLGRLNGPHRNIVRDRHEKGLFEQGKGAHIVLVPLGD